MGMKSITNEKQGLGKNFWIYFVIMFSSAFVDNILKNSLIVYTLFNGISVWGLSPETLAPVAAGIFILPFLLFSAAAGQWCDKENKKTIVIICKGIELLIGIAVLYLFPQQKISWMILCLFFLGLHSSIFGPAKYSMIKDLVTPKNFVLATAWVEAGTFVSILMGTIGGSMIASYQLWDNYGAGLVMVTCSSIAFALSFFLPSFTKSHTQKIDFNPITSSLTVVKQVRTQPRLNEVIKQISWFYFLATFLITMMPAIVKNDFQQSEQWVSWGYALFIIGVALGSFIFERLSKNEINLMPMFSSMWMILWMLILVGIVLPFSNNTLFFVVSIVFLFCLALFMGVFSTPLYALLQKLPAANWQSQAVATNNIVNSLYMISASILQIILYHLNMSHAVMFYVLAFCWLWAKKSIFKEFAYEFIYHFVSNITNLRYKVKIEGAHFLPQNGPYIIISNHVSFIDWAFLGRVTKDQIRFVMWYFYYDQPILKTFFSSAGAIPIAGKKEDEVRLKMAFQEIKKALLNNERLLYFPEGGITKNGEVDIFRPGIVEILKNHQQPITIIPAYLGGMWESVFSRNPSKWKGFTKRILRRREIKVRLGEPLSADNSVDVESLRARVLDLR
jgi:1-acyl-sn-glycerol-3-phosphate acyltransferase